MITRRRKRQGMVKKNTRVDFTPMVDMNMLLLTFFMFCTTLSKPQVMDLVMPVPSDDPTPTEKASLAITFLLDGKNDLYYYNGLPDYEDYASLKKISYDELRNVVAEKNRHIVAQVNEAKAALNNKTIDEATYKKAVLEIKKQKEGITAVIKATDQSVYSNLVDVLDEMVICSVGRYAVVDITESDEFLIKNYQSKGEFAKNYVLEQ